MGATNKLADVKIHAALNFARAFTWAQAKFGDPAARVVALHPDEDPYPVYEQVRARGELVPSRIGFHITASHRLCNAVLRDPRFRTAGSHEVTLVELGLLDRDPNGVANPVEESFLVRNPPDHTRLRRLAAPWFTLRALRERQAFIDKVVAEFLDGIAGRDQFDLIDDFAAGIPIRVITDMLGVPDTEHARFSHWGTVLATALDGVRDMPLLREVRVVLREMDAFFRDLVEQRRRQPGDDVVSDLVRAQEQDPTLTRRDLFATAQLLLVAGFETTVNLIGNGALALMANPAARRALVTDPDATDRIVEELLRLETPVQYTMRLTTEPLELAGVRLRADTPVVLLLAAANRDPLVFPDPHRFDPDRPNGRDHLAFSAGIHYCLGAGLARMEAAATLRALFTRYPDLRLAGPVRRRPSQIVRGAQHLPVRTGPVRALAG